MIRGWYAGKLIISVITTLLYIKIFNIYTNNNKLSYLLTVFILFINNLLLL